MFLLFGATSGNNFVIAYLAKLAATLSPFTNGSEG